MIYLGRAVGFVGACTFFAVIYIKSMVRTQDQVLNRLWLLMWLCGVPTSMAVVAVYSYVQNVLMLSIDYVGYIDDIDYVD
mgnify:CR=1